MSGHRDWSDGKARGRTCYFRDRDETSPLEPTRLILEPDDVQKPSEHAGCW
ncbi:MAG: hypothetical protein KDA79_10185 [Planctomycetaceae bacterium]|nr:hypothetical protein [Planctomycetaceae bacterium]